MTLTKKIIGIVQCVLVFFASPLLFDMSLSNCYAYPTLSYWAMPIVSLLLLGAYFAVIRGCTRRVAWILAYIASACMGMTVRYVVSPPGMQYYPFFPEIPLILSAIVYVLFGILLVSNSFTKIPIPTGTSNKMMFIWGFILLLTVIIFPVVCVAIGVDKVIVRSLLSVSQYCPCVISILFLRQCKFNMRRPVIGYGFLLTTIVLWFGIILLPIWFNLPSAIVELAQYLVFPVIVSILISVISIIILEKRYINR